MKLSMFWFKDYVSEDETDEQTLEMLQVKKIIELGRTYRSKI